MDDFWFVPYHAYSTSNEYDEKALRFFETDIKFAQKIGIKNLIMEDYYKTFLWGEYTSFWNKRNFAKMIDITHDYGLKFIPYTNATELSIQSETYKKNGKIWGAKNRWGKIYSGFNSIFLPKYYPNPKLTFFTKLMCPISGWKDYLIKQIEELLENFEIDGIYFDRVDYRINCFDHSTIKEHFEEGIPNLLGQIVRVVKNKSQHNISIMNDSCMPPDDILKKNLDCIDMVLSELLPIDWNPNSLLNTLNLYFGDIAWRLRKYLLPITRLITEKQFQSKSMTNFPRISSIVERLKRHKTPDNIILFTHRRDEIGFKSIKKIAKSKGCKIAYFVGLKKLISLKNWQI